MPSKLAYAKSTDYDRRGAILQRQGRYREALSLHDRAVALVPHSAQFQYNRANALLMTGRFPEAIIGFTRAIRGTSRVPQSHNGIGVALHRMHRNDEAALSFQQAIDLDPNYSEALCNLGTVLREQGKLDDARTCFLRAIEINPHNGRFYRYLVDGVSAATSAAYLPLIESALPFVAHMTPDQQTEYNFSLARVYEAAGRYDDAFERLQQGNVARRKNTTYDENAELRLMATMAATFNASFCNSIGPCGPSSERPVFIVGMPRSGTTLVEQILAMHPLVHGAGELRAFDRASRVLVAAAGLPRDRIRIDIARLGEQYLREIKAFDGERVTDKMPFNFRYLGLIHLALPNARIIALERDALDVCFSCYATFFFNSVPFSYDLRELARYYRSFERLLKHWQRIIPPNRLLTVAYEDIVDDIEGSVRRLLDFCGLPWDARCLEFHQAQRTVRTASHSQVRQPLYRDSLGRAERFGAHLQPLIDELNL